MLKKIMVAAGLAVMAMSDLAAAYETLPEIIIKSRPGRYSEGTSTDNTSAVSVQPIIDLEDASVQSEPEDKDDLES